MAALADAGPSHAPGGAAPQWRQFGFFDLEDVKDAEDLASSPRALKDLSPPILLTPTSPESPLPASIIVASGQTITLLDRHFQPLTTWTAWEGNGRATHLAEAGGLVLAIGEEDGSRYPVLKIWDVTREEKKRKGGGPVMMRNTKIQNGQRPHPVSAIALSSTLSHLAIGLGDGTVLVYRHLLQSLTTSPTSLTSLPKARIIHESPEPITGLGFREAKHPSRSAVGSKTAESTTNGSTTGPLLYICTINRVLIGELSSRSGQAKSIDESGCGLGCAVSDWEGKDMIVARDEGVYVYTPGGRGMTYAYEGPKSSISTFKQNLIVVSPPFVPSASSNSATVRQYVAKSGSSDNSRDIGKVTIFDLQNKLIAYSGTFKDGVREVFCQWGDVFALSSNGKLSRLDEHSTQAKLEVLYRRNLYTLALDLAKTSGMPTAGLAEIHKKYGDYLYGKGDFDGSMSQFTQTLGHLQPSYVIRKFLDAQRIHNLTTYLQSLHSHNLANPDHTTLLLNCYTKTDDRTALDNFIKTETRRADEAGGGLDDLPFDLETAIRVCRQAGFFEHASYLARKYGRHEEFLRVQIEDAEEYGDALKYLRSLGPVSCQENMMIYGRTLLQHNPEDTTDLLIDLCSGTLGKPKPVPTQVDDGGAKTNGLGGPAVLSYLGYNRVAGMFTSDPTSSSVPPPAPSRSMTAISNVEKTASRTAQPEKKPSVDRTREPTTDDSSKVEIEPTTSYIPPSPRQYFAHFIDHHDLFIHFLEAVALTLWDQKVDTSSASRIVPVIRPPGYDTTSDRRKPFDPIREDQTAVWNTLLELYLDSTSSSDSSISTLARSKALGLLSSDLPHDSMHALLLCSTTGFTDGMVRLWENMGMYEDVLRFWMSALTPSSGSEGVHPSDEVLRCLNLYGPSNPHLYPLVLRYLTSSSEVLGRQSGQIGKILEQIDEQRIMPPLAVVQLLSRNGVASVGNVKDWLRSKVAETRQDVESDKSLVQSYRTETAQKTTQLTSLANPTQPEIFQVTRCASCSQQLDLPAVHFMCKHSYHQRCLSDSDPECILCARQHAVIREVRRNQTRLAGRHELFIGEVEEADDGFAAVVGGFGRGLMNLRVEG